MRVLAVIGVVALAAGLGAQAAEASPALARTLQLVPRSDGLEVANGVGLVVVTGNAAVLGRAGRGFVVVDREERDPSVSVFGADWRRTSPGRTIYGGRALRFRIVGEGTRVSVAGRDLDLTVAASGYAAVKGDAGRLRLIDRASLPLPDFWRTFRLGAGDGAAPTRRSLLRLEIRWLRIEGVSWAAVKQTATWHEYRALGGS